MLTESKEVDKIEVVTDYNVLQVRTATSVKKDGEEIARSYHRHIVCPGDDLSNEDAKVVSIANALWTPELIAAFNEKRDADLGGLPRL